MTETARSRPVRVMLVEDNADVRGAVAAVLNAAGDLQVCAEAATVAEAGALAESTAPDVVIVDLRLPDGSGVTAARDVRASHPEARVLLLTSSSDEEALLASVLAGASAYLIKQLLGNDLVATVRAVAQGKTLIGPAPAWALERLQDFAMAAGDGYARLLVPLADARTDREIGQDLELDELEVHGRVASMASMVCKGLRRHRADPPGAIGRALPH